MPAERVAITHLALPSTAEAVALARAHLVAVVATSAPRLVQDAVLLVSELVTNAVRHGRAPITLNVEAAPLWIRAQVHDGGLHLPSTAVTPSDPEATGGRGLTIVAALATRWGVTPDDGLAGKTLWFELTDSDDATVEPSRSASGGFGARVGPVAQHEQ